MNAFFHCRQWKDALLFSSFFLLALSFWILQNLKQVYETEINIPIKLKNVPTNVLISDTLPTQISVTIKDKGSVLLNYTLGQHASPIEIDIDNLIRTQKSENIVIKKEVIESEILKRIITSSSLVTYKPQKIDIKFGKLKEKKVPIVFNGNITTKTGFNISDSILISPELISVFASEDILNNLHSINTETINIKEANKTIKKNIGLIKPSGTSLEKETVSITIPIEEFTEKKITLPIECKNLPKDYVVRMFPASVEIVCNIPVSKFRSTNNSDFVLEVDFEELKNNNSGKITPRLVEKPEWIKNISINPSSIEFIIEQNFRE